jgi:chromosomal replication initiator protein
MQASAEKIWTAAQEHLRSMLSRDTYNLWFAPLRACDEDNDAIVLEVANDFCEVWLKDNYMALLQDVVALASGHQLQIKFRVGPSNVAATAAVPAQEQPKTAEVAPERSFVNHDFNFNPKNTFETFVVGSNNNFAYAAALAVAQSPGKSYNPLFLYGGVGLGKTHLLHAIGQHVTGQKKNARVAYVSSEKFTNEYIDGIQNNQLAKFRKKYRQTEVLLIDDIQFLAGKERIQEEFFHTFNALHEAHKQIVLTCDRPASEIQGLEHRLVSRFEWGLVTDLQPPRCGDAPGHPQ